MVKREALWKCHRATRNFVHPANIGQFLKGTTFTWLQNSCFLKRKIDSIFERKKPFFQLIWKVLLLTMASKCSTIHLQYFCQQHLCWIHKGIAFILSPASSWILKRKHTFCPGQHLLCSIYYTSNHIFYIVNLTFLFCCKNQIEYNRPNKWVGYLLLKIVKAG